MKKFLLSTALLSSFLCSNFVLAQKQIVEPDSAGVDTKNGVQLGQAWDPKLGALHVIGELYFDKNGDVYSSDGNSKPEYTRISEEMSSPKLGQIKFFEYGGNRGYINQNGDVYIVKGWGSNYEPIDPVFVTKLTYESDRVRVRDGGVPVSTPTLSPNAGVPTPPRRVAE